MKKEKIVPFFYTIATLLGIAFFIRVGVDFIQYDSINNSAPFYVYVLVRAITFLLPSIFFFVLGKIIKKKEETNEK